MPPTPVWIDLSVLPAFLATVLVLLLAPGPDMAFMVASGLNGGRKAAVRAALGITAGVSVYVLAIAVGIGAILATAPVAVTVIRIAGGVYLFYLAIATWRASNREPAVMLPDPKTGKVKTASYFRRGAWVALSNPKILIFFTAFLPQFLGDVTGNPIVQLLVLGLIAQVLGVLVDLCFGLAAGAMRDRVLGNPRTRVILDRVSATVFALIAVALLVEVGLQLLAP